jgi:polycystin 1L2
VVSRKCFAPTGTFFTHVALQNLRLYLFTDGWHPFVVAAELIYFVFLFYYMVVQVRGTWDS